MEEISHSVRKVKQAKKKWMTVQSVQSRWHVRTADVAGPECDTWQHRMMTHGSTRMQHMAGGFEHTEVQLDQYRGDTCHH
jgi:hypothetical protein